MRYLFEDDITCFPYQLLPQTCRSKVYGIKGNKNLLNACRTEFISNTVVFVDVNADNPNTVSIYNKLTREASKRDNQFIVPIPCIEYYFVKAFLVSRNPHAKEILQFDEFRYLIRNGEKTYEKCVKHFVELNGSCFHDKSFAMKPCLCSESGQGCIELPLDLKQLYFICNLPIFIASDQVPDIINKVIATQKELYYKQVKKFLELGIISIVYDLV